MKDELPVKGTKLTKAAKKKQIKAGIALMQEISGITVTRAAICRGIFPKPMHIFYIAKSKTGVQIRYEIQLPLEKEIGQENVIREIIKSFPRHANKVN